MARAAISERDNYTDEPNMCSLTPPHCAAELSPRTPLGVR